MAKKLLQSYYEFNASAKTVVIPKFVKHEEVLIITNVTLNTIVYNFADATRGFTSVSWDPINEKTTLTLDYGAPGASNTDKLQIFVDEPEQKMDISDSLLDPVHKIRVSNPQNLIDTDFEYGLQPTKWETLELSNNIPSTYIQEGIGYLENVVSVSATSGSDVITVTSSEPHGLDVGVPIDIQGLASRTAEGKYIIKFKTDNTFAYQAKSVQTISGNISGVYTTIAPGTFFDGSQITYDNEDAIISDENPSSQITWKTRSQHGFEPGANFYLVNTVAKKELLVSNTASDLALDGKKYVEPADTVTLNLTGLDQTLTETKRYIPVHSVKFNGSAVNTSNDTITWENHKLRDNDCIAYIPPSGDTPIGGLANFEVYYVIVDGVNTIKLTSTYNGSAINLSSVGTYNYGRACIGLIYEIKRSFQNSNDRYAYHFTRYDETGIGSGWDLDSTTASTDTTGYGIGDVTTVNPTIYRGWLSRNGSITNVNARGEPGRYYTPYSSGINANYGFAFTAGATPTPYHYYENGGASSTVLNDGQASSSFYAGDPRGNGTGIRTYQGLTGTASVTINRSDKDVFWAPCRRDEEADTIHIQNHGLENGTPITFTFNSGNIGYHFQTSTSTSTTTSTTGWSAEVVSEDRIRLRLNGSTIKLSSFTGSYSLTASVSDPLRDTFYLPAHGLVDGQSLTFVSATGVPTSAPGTITPNLPSTANFKFEKIRDWFDTYLSNNFTAVNTMVANDTNWSNSGRFVEAHGGMAYGQCINVTLSLVEGFTYQTGASNLLSTNLSNAVTTTGWQPYTNNDFFKNTETTYRATDTRNSGNKFMLLLSDGKFKSIQLRAAGDYFQGGYSYIRSVYTGTDSTPTRTTRNRQYTGPTSGITWYGQIGSAYGVRGSDQHFHISFSVRPSSAGQSNYNYLDSGGFSSTWSNNWISRGNNTRLTEEEICCSLYFWCTGNVNTFGNTELDSMLDSFLQNADTNFGISALTAGNSTYTVQVPTPNRVRLLDPNSSAPYNLTNSGTSPMLFRTGTEPGIVDGAYTATSASVDTVQFVGQNKVVPIDYEFNASTDVSTQTIQLENANNNHHFIRGAQVTYNANGNTPVGGLVDGDTYYVVQIDDQFVGLANTYANALSDNNITLTTSTGTHIIEGEQISGLVSTPGTISVTENSTYITGTNTLLKRYFKTGDVAYIRTDITAAPGELTQVEIASVTNDTQAYLAQPFDLSDNPARIYSTTKIYARPDGYAVHRPFDGGVEIAAGTAPHSQILRQTRKYFRYQSGKGIQTSLAINFNPPTIFESLTSSGLTATAKTTYPHRLASGQAITIKESSDNVYNGTFNVVSVVDEFTFTFTLGSTPSTTIPSGIIKYNLAGYDGSFIRAGMFDFQNGFFFEFNGREIFAVRRSSTTQLSGRAQVTKKSNVVRGTNTNFTGQINVQDFVVIRGQSYKVVAINSKTEMIVQPEYKGTDATEVIITKTEDVRVPQTDWNIDKCDGNGPEGFNLDINFIQMAYMDYSWYGAGKVRFGFKDKNGHVRYCHEFLHNNRLDEAYMRSGNLPAKYEILNADNPDYAPTLFHWGTSVIMDGKFDEDEAYLFTAESNSFSFTGGASQSFDLAIDASWYTILDFFAVYFWLKLTFPAAAAASIRSGTILNSPNLGDLNGQPVDFTSTDSSGNIEAYIFWGYKRNTNSPNNPALSGLVATTTIEIGGGDVEEALNLGTDLIPLVSLRLAPSVDSNITGQLGERDIINRMQLKLNEVGLILTNEATVKLVLNGNISTSGWQGVKAPSLSQLYQHEFGETLDGGVEIFSFRASGGSETSGGRRLPQASNFPLDAVVDMGNSILGGDGIFPNGPDVLTVAVQVIDTAGISLASPFQASARITWSESQA